MKQVTSRLYKKGLSYATPTPLGNMRVLSMNSNIFELKPLYINNIDGNPSDYDEKKISIFSIMASERCSLMYY